MDARRVVLGALLVLVGCQAQSPSGQVVDVRKLPSKDADFLPSQPAKQDDPLKGAMGFNRPADDAGIHAAPKEKDDMPLHFKPVAFFAKNCASCHGDEGAKFDDGARRHALDKDFALKVAAMAKEQAKKPVFGRELAALAQYCQAVMTEAAYVAWVDGDLYEARPGSNLIARGGGEAKIMDGSKTDWSVRGLKDGSEILAVFGPSKASLMYPQAQSHGEFSLRR